MNTKQSASYGAWVLPDGRVLDVPPGGHKNAVSREMGNNPAKGYADAFRAGWVRVVLHPQLEIEKGNVHLTSMQRSALEDMIAESSGGDILVDAPNGSHSFDQEEAEKWLMVASDRVASELVKIAKELIAGELPNKWWGIIKDGKLVHSGNDVGMTMEHLSDMARRYGGEVAFADKPFHKEREIGDIFGYTWEQIRDWQHKG